jgi:hypothetical protein
MTTVATTSSQSWGNEHHNNVKVEDFCPTFLFVCGLNEKKNCHSWQSYLEMPGCYIHMHIYTQRRAFTIRHQASNCVCGRSFLNCLRVRFDLLHFHLILFFLFICFHSVCCAILTPFFSHCNSILTTTIARNKSQWMRF